MAPIVIEVLDQRGVVRQRARLYEFPVVLGRGYDNDVILDDRYVSPRHLRLLEDETGALVAEDIGSVNGLLLVGSGNGRAPERVPRVPVRSGTTLRIGRTTLRFFDPAHPVPEALPDAPATLGTRTRAELLRAALGATAAAALVFALQAWLGSSEKKVAGTMASAALVGVSMLLVWSGAWSLANRLVTHRFHPLGHLAWASLAAVVYGLAAPVGDWVEFFFPGDTLAGLLGALLRLAFAAVLLYGHLTVIGTMTPRGRWRAAAAVTAGVAALAVAFALADGDSSWRMDYSAQLEPAPAGMVPAVALDDFAADADALRDQVDELATKDADEDADASPAAPDAKAEPKPSPKPDTTAAPPKPDSGAARPNGDALLTR